jgi:hypothetical protein
MPTGRGNASSATGDLTVVPLDDDASLAPRSSPFLQVVLPGRPATFVGDGCLLVVGRDALVFDVVLLGALVNRNQQAIGQVLAVILAHAEAMSISLGGLDELDGAGAVMLDNALTVASRLKIQWTIADGELMWQAALNRSEPTPTNEVCSSRRAPARRVIPRRRLRTPSFPI